MIHQGIKERVDSPWGAGHTTLKPREDITAISASGMQPTTSKNAFLHYRLSNCLPRVNNDREYRTMHILALYTLYEVFKEGGAEGEESAWYPLHAHL